MDQPKTRRATLEDVAKLAGVSLGSASRVITNPSQVKARTREAVLRAAEQLAYVSNGAARALASKRTRTIGAVYPSMMNQAFVESLNALQDTLWTANYQVVLGVHEYVEDREHRVVRAILERGVDGLVLVGTAHDPATFQLIMQRRLPLVMTWQIADVAYGRCVGFNQWKPLFDLTKVVLAKGHKHIAVVCGPLANNDRARQRVAGTVDAMKEAGLELRPDWIVEQPFSIQGGRDAARRLMHGSQRPTVIMCHTDLQALGVMHECARDGFVVPDDISVTGMDDIALAEMASPPLTTIRVPTRRIGMLAAKKIVDMIEERGPVENTDTPCEIIVRESLGDLR